MSIEEEEYAAELRFWRVTSSDGARSISASLRRRTSGRPSPPPWGSSSWATKSAGDLRCKHAL